MVSEAPVPVLFMGSGAFAVPVLEALAAHPSARLAGVVTAPPRPVGRRGELTTTPVAARAASLGVPVLTPARLRDPSAVEAVEALGPGLIVLADYGRIVPQAILDLPPHRALNLHPSLLPRHRGASPIPAAILAGDAETGVTLMRMDAGLDTGPVVAQRRLPLRGDEVAPELEEHLARLAADLLVASLADWLAGRLAEVPQPEEGATLTRPLRREDGRLDPTRRAAELERQVRAYQPWPGSFIEMEGQRLVVWKARVTADAPSGTHRAAASTLTDVGDRGAGAVAPTLVPLGEGAALVTRDGLLELLEVQPQGRARMAASAWRRGRPTLLERGDRTSRP
jgi:methionyl-tRNA formyltransferase